MLNKSYIYFTAALLAIAIFTLAGCGGTSTAQNGQGAITAKLVWNGNKTTAKSVASAPTGVATVRLAISGTGITTVQQDFQASLGSGTLSSVPAGTGYTFTAYGLDSTGTIIYQGSAGNVTVSNGQTTDVGTITMLSVAAVETPPVAKTAVTIKGTVTSLMSLNSLVSKRTQKTIAASVTPEQIANGNVRVMAVDADGTVTVATTDANSQFSLTIPADKPYALLYMNSAGEYLGNQQINSKAMAFKATDNIDLGDISIANGNASASNNSPTLVAQTIATTIDKPAMVPISTSITTFSPTLYTPMNNGDIIVSQGTGDAEPGSLNAAAWHLTKTTTEFDTTLKKWVFIEWHYAMNDDFSVWHIEDKLYWYFDGADKVKYQKETANGILSDTMKVPDLLEYNKLYSFPGMTYQVTDFFNQKALVNGLGTFDGFISYSEQTQNGIVHKTYDWFAKGIGQVLTASNQDGTGIHMQVVYKKLGTGTEYGSRPDWLTVAVMSALPTAW